MGRLYAALSTPFIKLSGPMVYALMVVVGSGLKRCSSRVVESCCLCVCGGNVCCVRNRDLRSEACSSESRLLAESLNAPPSIVEPSQKGGAPFKSLVVGSRGCADAGLLGPCLTNSPLRIGWRAAAAAEAERAVLKATSLGESGTFSEANAVWYCCLGGCVN